MKQQVASGPSAPLQTDGETRIRSGTGGTAFVFVGLGEHVDQKHGSGHEGSWVHRVENAAGCTIQFSICLVSRTIAESERFTR